MTTTEVGASADAAVNRHRFGLAGALAPGSLFMLVFVWRASSSTPDGRQFTLFDDAMISLAYGRTLAETGKLVWFDGADRVQGITNPLWALYMAFVHLVGLEGSSAALAVNLTGLALVLWSAVLVHRILRQALGDCESSQAVALLAAGAVPFLYPLTFWTLRGMEVGVLAAALLVVIWATQTATSTEPVRRSRRVVATIAIVIGVLTRIDFVVLVGAIAVFVAVSDHAERPRARLRRSIEIAAPAVATAIAVLVAERLYYGDWLPNTYYLKVEGFSILDRGTRGLVSAGKALAVAAVCAGCVALVNRRAAPSQRRLTSMCAAAFSAGLAYSIWVGGDAWESFLMISRYISVVLPLAVVIVAIGAVEAHRSAIGGRRLATGLAAIPIAALFAGLVSNPYRFHTGFAAAMFTLALLFAVAFWMSLHMTAKRLSPTAPMAIGLLAVLALSGAFPAASWLRSGGLHVADDQRETQESITFSEVTDEEAVFATNWAGAPGYYVQREMIDLLGKSDPIIARMEPTGDLYPGHNKRDYAYSIGQLRPDVVLRVWAAESSTATRMDGWGYAVRCVRMADGRLAAANFLETSPYVAWERLTDCVDEG